MVDRILAASPGTDVLDVGCGTGIVARQFLAAGCRVLGVDADARMADVARQHGMEVEVSTFETWDPAGREFHVVAAGQSWHWVDPVAGAARAAEALSPRGRLAVFWNAFEPPPDLAAAFAEVYRRVAPDVPNAWAKPALEAYLQMCTRACDAMAAVGGFSQPEQWRFPWERPYTRDEWLDQLSTFGGHGQLPPAQLRDLLGGVGGAIDAAGGSFLMRYTTVVGTAARRPT